MDVVTYTFLGFPVASFIASVTDEFINASRANKKNKLLGTIAALSQLTISIVTVSYMLTMFGDRPVPRDSWVILVPLWNTYYMSTNSMLTLRQNYFSFHKMLLGSDPLEEYLATSKPDAEPLNGNTISSQEDPLAGNGYSDD